MSKQFIVIVLVVVLGLFGVLSLSKKNKENNQSNGSNNNSSSVKASENVYGKLDSKVTFLEYGDFQCPACKSYYPIIKQLKEDYKDKIKFQFRNYPLSQIHPNAFMAARAAESAAMQNKFFEMHDLLYENADAWVPQNDPSTLFASYALQLGLDANKFATDLKSQNISDIINADTKEGQKLGVNSTPTFAINGKKLDKNPTSIDEFKKLIDDELAKNQ